MRKKNTYIDSNGVKHVSPVSPASSFWPPTWLAKARKIAKANPLPPPQDNLPELAEWEDIEVVEAGEPCAKCGSLEKWWDPTGKEHCQQCEPIRRALALVDFAARLKRRK